MATALVLGGLTLVGRHLVRVLVDVADPPLRHIRVVDRGLLHVSFLNRPFARAFERVEYAQANLVNPEAVRRAFVPPDGHGAFDWVFNCTSELRPDQIEEVYRERLVGISLRCAEEAVRTRVPVFVQLSSGLEYVDKGVRATEDGEMREFSLRSKYLVEMDRKVQQIPNLNLVLVRPGQTFGPGEFGPFATSMAVAFILTQYGKEIPCPMDVDVRRSCVHARDVARAFLHLARWYTGQHKTGTEIFNLATPQDFHLGQFQKMVEDSCLQGRVVIVPTPGVPPTAESIEAMRQVMNQDLLDNWTDFLVRSGINACPIMSFYDTEAYSSLSVAVDGSRIERETGFVYECEELTSKQYDECIDAFKELNVWPKALCEGN